MVRASKIDLLLNGDPGDTFADFVLVIVSGQKKLNRIGTGVSSDIGLSTAIGSFVNVQDVLSAHHVSITGLSTEVDGMKTYDFTAWLQNQLM